MYSLNETMHRAKSWKPDRPVSGGASAFHKVAIKSLWNHQCIDELISLAEPNIHENQIVVDFGAGTGTSAVRILEKLKTKINLWLVDNSPSWLGKAYELLSHKQGVDFFVLEKKGQKFATLAETVGIETVDHVMSANTVHLIPDLKEAFKGIFDAIKPNGTFVFNSGNITRDGRPEGALIIDSTVFKVHDIAIDIINENSKFKKYRHGLDERIEAQIAQRKFIFPEPRPIENFLDAVKDAGFQCTKIYYKCFKLKYSDWLDFLRIKRLQAGILPEVGGKEPSVEEEKDRDDLITMAARKVFAELRKYNPMADDESYQGEWAYVLATKPA